MGNNLVKGRKLGSIKELQGVRASVSSASGSTNPKNNCLKRGISGRNTSFPPSQCCCLTLLLGSHAGSSNISPPPISCTHSCGHCTLFVTLYQFFRPDSVCMYVYTYIYIHLWCLSETPEPRSGTALRAAPTTFSTFPTHPEERRGQ